MNKILLNFEQGYARRYLRYLGYTDKQVDNMFLTESDRIIREAIKEGRL